MSCIRWLPLLFLLWGIYGLGQEGLTVFAEPSVALNYRVGPHLKQNASIRSRHFLVRDGESFTQTRQADLSVYTSYTWLGNSSVALGVMYRFRDPFQPGSGNELRVTEQFDFRRSFGPVRLGQRARWEQRIFQANTVHRLRYRLSADLPLQGEKADVREFYLIGQGEPLLSLGRSRAPQWDLRLTGWLGYQISGNTRLQIGGEYRWEALNTRTREVLLFLTSLVLTL